MAISAAENKDLLLNMTPAYSCTFLVLDALDECDPQLRGQLIELFQHLVTVSTGLKVLISSRWDGDIKHQLEKKAISESRLRITRRHLYVRG
jgi:hypothetical protein